MLPPWLPAMLVALPIQGGDPGSGGDSSRSGFDLSGEATFGWRFLGVRGSRSQFDEDQNLDQGAILRQLRIEGRNAQPAGGIRSFLLDAYGVGDPQSSYRGEIAGSALKALARFDRTRFSGAAEDDLHPFDFKRERGSLRVESAGSGAGDLRGSLGFSYGRRDGFSLGTRSVGFGFIDGIPVRQRDENRGVDGDLGFGALGWDFKIDGGLGRLETRDRRDAAGPAPNDPNTTDTERFRARGEATSSRIGMRARHSFDGGKTAADGGLEYDDLKGDGHMHSFETGVLSGPGDDFQRTTTSDANTVDRSLRMDAGLRRQVSPGLAWRARIERVEEVEGGDVVRDSLLEEPPGSTPSELIESQSLNFDRTLDMAEVGVETGLTDSTDLDATVEVGRAREKVLDTFGGVTQHRFDDTVNEIGGRATLSVEASREVEVALSAGYEIAPTPNQVSQAFLTLEDERGLFASARVRWKARPGVSLSATLKHRERDIPAFGSHYESNSLSLAGSFVPSASWSADASLSLRQYDLAADTTFILLVNGTPQQLDERVFFRGMQTVLAGSVSWQVSPSFRPRFGASGVVVNGDANLLYGALLLDLPWKPGKDLTLGTEIDLHRFDSQESSATRDYDSAAVLLYVRTGF